MKNKCISVCSVGWAMLVLHVTSYTCLLVANYVAAATTLIGGQNTGDVTKNVHTFVDPAPFAFAIWSVIYLCAGAFVYSAPQVSRAWLLCAVVNPSWLVVWGYRRWFLSLVLIVVYAVCAVQLLHETAGLAASSSLEWVAFRVFPAIHAAWLVCASTVALVIVTEQLVTNVPPTVCAALLWWPLLCVGWLLPRSPWSLGVVLWAAFAIHATNARRLARNGKQVCSRRVLWSTRAIMASCVWLMLRA